MGGSDLNRRSALELARLIRAGETTSRAVVDAHIAVLERANPRINAVAADRYAAAREEADAADARVAAGTEGLPPLHGVPCTIKESIAVRGMPNSSGVVARGELRASEDAPLVARLREAGSIVLGVTNTSELTMWIETENRLYGRTNNPYDARRTAGGSSGGEGAAIGAGGSPFGVGTDLGGSIRIPAFCNGIFGHKSSLGLIGIEGVWPVAEGERLRMLSVGPMARRAEDLWPLVKILAEPDRRAGLGDPADVRLDGLTVIVSDEAWLRPISHEVLAARERAAGALAAAGARVEHRSLRQARRALEYYLAALAAGGGVSAQEILLDAGAEPATWRTLCRRTGPHTLATRAMLATERIADRVPDRHARKLVASGRALAEEIAETIGNGVILHPPLAATAPKHNRMVGRPWWLLPMALFNLAAVPVTQVPLGLAGDGLPLGVQVAAAPGNDHLAVAVALELERVFGGWVPPPGLLSGDDERRPHAAVAQAA